MTSPSDVSKVRGLSDVANSLGVSRVTLWRAIRDGKLVAFRVGRRTYVRESDLLDYVLAYRGGKGIPEA